MTSVGHSLTGLSIGVLCLPRGWRRRGAVSLLVGFALLANAPDLSLPGWGHDRYDISHSLFVNAAIIVVLLLAARAYRPLWERAGRGRVAACGAAAWLSHLLLDTLYNHGMGLAIYWPFSDARLALSLPWFSTLRGGLAWDGHTLRVILVELAFYAPLLLLAVALRLVVIRRQLLPRPPPHPG